MDKKQFYNKTVDVPSQKFTNALKVYARSARHAHDILHVCLCVWVLTCPVGYVEMGGGLTCHAYANRSENYLLLGFLLVGLCQYRVSLISL